ncbi:MAG: pyruvate, phosphate dikinase [bacterium]|nr:pyruvate, phosphate dikinase [bacterium]
MAKKKAAKTYKPIYYFGQSSSEGRKVPKSIVGGKGKNLAEMTAIGLPVPPGFTVSTVMCDEYNKKGKMPAGLMDEVRKNITKLEKETGKKFGDKSNPLLVSVRSGAAISMPGMMDTILNLGLNDDAVEAVAEATGTPRFAYDSYRRLIDMFGNVVMGVDHHAFEEAFAKVKKKHNVTEDTDVTAEGMKELCDAYKAVYKKGTGEDFPQDPAKQLELAIQAVFKSWNVDRAVAYRRIEGIRGLLGTAVNVQTMAYGNTGDDSGTGVAFTRDKATGKNEFTGDFLVNAQGEDVVAGIRTPKSVHDIKAWNKDVYKELIAIKKTLEDHYTDMQDIEFTIERGKLYMLQTRTGKRSGAAAVKIACDMVKEGLIDEKEALLRIPGDALRQLMLPSFDPAAKEKAETLTIGLNASPGAAVGKLAFTAEEAAERKAAGEAVILVRAETSPEDVSGMEAATGILTSTGGMTSHAAVVAVGWGKCCIVGAGEVIIDEKGRKAKINGVTLTHKDTISLDGTTGEVMKGEITTIEPKIGADFKKVLKWSDEYRTIGVRTNADSPADAKVARDYGAEGIGLCRTEHMFFDHILPMREMILSETVEDREAALKKLLPIQRKDFVGIFTAMKGLPVTVRLLDPPLHEFLPHDKKGQKDVADTLGVAPKKIKERVDQLHESNPMLGHRGCRLSVTYPEILVMQVTAIVEAVIACKKKRVDAKAEIMIPLVGTAKELEILKDLALETIEAVREKKGFEGDLGILIGTMLEIPRACLTADDVAKHAQFFSFGTNDLTQMTFGYSRDDAGVFLPEYVARDILPADPFASLDTTGVGQLVEMGVQKGRSTRKDLKIGICGEHGGDPASIEFCVKTGLDYVSCSPFRVPVARLAAAQAAIKASK